jgi:hypothetical protein
VTLIESRNSRIGIGADFKEVWRRKDRPKRWLYTFYSREQDIGRVSVANFPLILLAWQERLSPKTNLPKWKEYQISINYIHNFSFHLSYSEIDLASLSHPAPTFLDKYDINSPYFLVWMRGKTVSILQLQRICRHSFVETSASVVLVLIYINLLCRWNKHLFKAEHESGRSLGWLWWCFITSPPLAWSHKFGPTLISSNSVRQ